MAVTSEQRLWQSLFEQVRSERFADNRAESLKAAFEAARIKSAPELRQEAIQTITSSGVSLLREVEGIGVAFSPDGARLVCNDIRQVGDDWLDVWSLLIDVGHHRVETPAYDGLACATCEGPFNQYRRPGEAIKSRCLVGAFLSNDELLLYCAGCLQRWNMTTTRLGKLATREQDNATRPKAAVGRGRRCKCVRWQDFRPRSPMG
jgi:hypothetical protein